MKKRFITVVCSVVFMMSAVLTVNAEENTDATTIIDTQEEKDHTEEKNDIKEEETQEIIAKWIKEADGWRYQREDGSYPSDEWCEIDNKRYAFDEYGYMRTGWYQSDKVWYYCNANGTMAEGWVKDGKWYYLTPGSGAMAEGWQKISGKWYYLAPGSGAMVTGWFQEGGKWYYCYQSGVMASDTYVGAYYVNRSGVWISDTKQIKNEQALAVAQEIADSISAGSDLDRVAEAAYIVSLFCANATYMQSGENYNTAYGVFIAGEYSCAGATRALGMVLECMGYSWEHVNPNQWTHQWCRVTMDGQVGWADGQIGMAGYGSHPVEWMQ